MCPRAYRAVLECFIRLHEEGKVYRSEKVGAIVMLCGWMMVLPSLVGVWRERRLTILSHPQNSLVPSPAHQLELYAAERYF